MRIALPGELPGEAAQRATDARAEAVYAAQAAGSAAVEAASMAIALAAALQDEQRAATGRVEVPVEERGAPPRTPPLPNPARRPREWVMPGGANGTRGRCASRPSS